MAAFYDSPRWSGELLDCSMPMTFDQYNRCSYDCLYCFSFFQRALMKYNPIFKDKQDLYTEQKPISVNVDRVKGIFEGTVKSEFTQYTADQIALQWGGLSDPFDMFEKKYGVGLEMMRYLHSRKYPICFSTKGTWWTEDSRYIDLFRKNDFWNVKFSIINLQAERAKIMERGVPTPAERLIAMKKLSRITGAPDSVTLRLRPFIIGYSNKNGEHIELVHRAKEAGAGAVSMEFLCIESRMTPESRGRFDEMSEIIGFDLMDFYRKNTVSPTGYLRLNWKIKQKYVEEVEKACKDTGMRFYVSDAHWKDKCSNGSCCGLGQRYNYSRGQFTEALLLAKKKGSVRWEDFEGSIPTAFETTSVTRAHFLNIARGNPRDRERFRTWSIKDYMRHIWNTPNHPRSPYKYFYGLLKANGTTTGGNVIYEYSPYNSGTGAGRKS